MLINLYKTSSDRLKLDKILTLVKSLTNVTLKDSPNSLTDPTIIVGTFENWNTVNYIYIPDFGRYYFVKDKRELQGGRIEYICHVDVLTTNQTGVLNLNAIVNRSSSNGNKYIVDGEVGVLNYRSQNIINFPDDKKFNTSLTYILTVAGGEVT